MNIKQVIELVEEFNRCLSAYDFSPMSCVEMVDDEGCRFLLQSAFAIRLEEYLIIYSEHHDPISCHKDELVSISVNSKPKKFSQIKRMEKYVGKGKVKKFNIYEEFLTTIINKWGKPSCAKNVPGKILKSRGSKKSSKE